MTGKSIGVLHILEDYSLMAGGLPEVVSQLYTHVGDNHINMRIIHAIGGRCDGKAQAVKPSILGQKWSWSPSLKGDIAKALSDLVRPSLAHLHGIWSAPQFVGGRACMGEGIPFILSSHGMLEPWLWNNQGALHWLKKNLYWKSLAYPVFKSAEVIHAITKLERDNLFKLFPKNKIEIIPNAINVDNYSIDKISSIEKEKIILFLGRIEPKKGVHILIQAFSKAQIHRDWKLVIVGPSWSKVYMNYLVKLVKDSGLGHRVQFLGALFGPEKDDWIEKAWTLVAPSFSEVVGMVNLEASARGVPTITTHETGLFDWELGGGLLIHPRVYQLKSAIENSCGWSYQERIERGFSSRSLIEARYSWAVVSPIWKKLYLEII